MGSLRARVLSVALAAGTTAAAAAILRARPPRGAATWERTNFRGRTVSLLGGVATAVGALAAAVTAPTPERAGVRPARLHAGAVLATGTAAAIGLADDLDTDAGASKGLRGHLAALARGEVTTGALKLLGISGAAVAAAAIMTGGDDRRPGSRSLPARGLDALIAGGLIAGTANLINLFDLRPGRGLKAGALLALPLACTGGPGAPFAAGALAVAGAAAPTDLAEETMLGDVGANALGALVGVSLALHPSAGLRAGALAGIATLTLASEKVSFSAVIEAQPALRALDALGRVQPAEQG